MDVRRFSGVHMREDVPKNAYCGVINLDDTDETGGALRGGTHWTAWYNGCYFDSFGSPPPEELMKAVKLKKYNSTVFQDPDDVSCGYWCIKFLYDMQDSKGNFEHVMSKLMETKEGELVDALNE